MAHGLQIGLRNGGLRRGGLRAGFEGGSIFNIASLDLNFAKYKNIGSLVTFTRASSGTFVGSDGLIKTATTNEARFDHNPTTGESLGLLVEEARTNLLLRSEELDNASWTASEATITANQIAAPNGTTTADLFTTSATTGVEHYILQSFTVAASTAYTASVYAKAGTGSIFDLQYRVAGAWAGGNVLVGFNLSTQVVTITSGTATASITPVGNGWFRCQITATSSVAGGSPQFRIATGDGGGTLYLWGAQLEAGAFPTSYIPTTTAAATRSADVASIGSSAFTPFYNQSEGTMFVDFLRAYSGNFPNFPNLYQFNDGTNDNEITVFGIQGGQLFQPSVVIGASSQVNFVTVASIFPGPNRCAHSLSLNNSVFAGNGVLTTPDTSVNLPTVNQVKFGDRGGQRFTGHYKRICFWRQALPGATLQAITG